MRTPVSVLGTFCSLCVFSALPFESADIAHRTNPLYATLKPKDVLPLGPCARVEVVEEDSFVAALRLIDDAVLGGQPVLHCHHTTPRLASPTCTHAHDRLSCWAVSAH